MCLSFQCGVGVPGLGCPVLQLLYSPQNRPDADTGMREAGTDASTLRRWLSTGDTFCPCLSPRALTGTGEENGSGGGGALCTEDLGEVQVNPLGDVFLPSLMLD